MHEIVKQAKQKSVARFFVKLCLKVFCLFYDCISNRKIKTKFYFAYFIILDRYLTSMVFIFYATEFNSCIHTPNSCNFMFTIYVM